MVTTKEKPLVLNAGLYMVIMLRYSVSIQAEARCWQTTLLVHDVLKLLRTHFKCTVTTNNAKRYSTSDGKLATLTGTNRSVEQDVICIEY